MYGLFLNYTNLPYFCAIFYFHTMKILVVPLNWGLGHASRCVPIIRRWLHDKNEVVLGGDGDSLFLLKRTFPTLRIIPFPSLQLHYSGDSSQVGAVIRMLPRLLMHTFKDRQRLKDILDQEHFDWVVSDNRFGLWRIEGHPDTRHIYITHQLNIRLPKRWQWLEVMATAVHRMVYSRYDEVWVPDYADPTKRLAGYLSEGGEKTGAVYIGPLSRMKESRVEQRYVPNSKYDVVAVLSGLEPQRSLLEKQIAGEYDGKQERVLIVRGRLREPFIRIRHNNITLVPYLYDQQLIPLLLAARRIIARSGYSTIMDLEALGVLHKAVLVPTPGQSEQEYLAQIHQPFVL